MRLVTSVVIFVISSRHRVSRLVFYNARDVFRRNGYLYIFFFFGRASRDFPVFFISSRSARRFPFFFSRVSPRRHFDSAKVTCAHVIHIHSSGAVVTIEITR